MGNIASPNIIKASDINDLSINSLTTSGDITCNGTITGGKYDGSFSQASKKAICQTSLGSWGLQDGISRWQKILKIPTSKWWNRPFTFFFNKRGGLDILYVEPNGDGNAGISRVYVRSFANDTTDRFSINTFGTSSLYVVSWISAWNTDTLLTYFPGDTVIEILSNTLDNEVSDSVARSGTIATYLTT